MKNSTLILLLCISVTMGCQPGDTEPNECEEGDERSCGSSPCRGTKQCVDGEWGECSSVGTNCGECCVCDEEMHVAFDCDECRDRDGDGYLTFECGGEDCDDEDHRVYPERWDECDGIDNNCNDVVDEDEGIQECGSIDVCEGWRFCVDGEISACSSEGRDCGPCCRCNADGNEVIDCGVCEDGRGEICGEDVCQGFRVCIGDEWSSCSTEGNDCGPCCRCDADGLPGETCEECDDGHLIDCGSGLCTDMRICFDGAYSYCGSMGRSCGECCECDENGNEQSICDTCEDGDIELCGSGDCGGYHVCYGDTWGACSTEGLDCGHCCTCDAAGLPQAHCTTCEEGEARACGSGDCLGFQVCVSDSWSTCSTALRDCGVCCRCDVDGNVSYDDTQDSDCPDFDCPAYSGCDYGWAYCGGVYGYHLYVELIAHRVGGACSDIDSCGHEECYTSEWKVCESDSDGDHYTESCGDCDDSDPLIHPAYIEVCGDFIDNDCDGTIEEGCCLDWDGDGHIDGTCGGTDCDDGDSSIHPGATEVCDGVDNNCDGVIDDADVDGDGYIDMACGGTDCDDTRSAIHPGALEICDGRDNDCDGGNDNLADANYLNHQMRNVIPSSKCSTDPCCTYITHREPGLVFDIDIATVMGIDFSAINPARVNVTVDAERLYYANTAYSDARVEYRVNYATSGTGTQNYNFRSPRHSVCGSLYGTPGASNPLTFTSSGTNYPLSVEWWVPIAGDYGVSLKNFEIDITMSCY